MELKTKVEVVEYDGKYYDIKYQHVRAIDPLDHPLIHGGRTRAYIVLEKDEKGKPTKVIEATARCSEKDAYSKRIGRMISRGRLLKFLGVDKSMVKKVEKNGRL